MFEINSVLHAVLRLDIITFRSVKGFIIFVIMYICLTNIILPIYKKKIKRALLTKVLLDEHPWLRF